MEYKLNIKNDILWINECIGLINKVYENKGEYKKGDFKIIPNEDRFSNSIDEIYDEFSDLIEFQENILKEGNKLYKKDSIWNVLSNPFPIGRGLDSYLLLISMNTKFNNIENISKEEFLLMNFKEIYYIFYNQGTDEFMDENLLKGKYKSSYFTNEKYEYDLKEIYELIDNINISDEYKYAILKIYGDIDNIYIEFMDLLEKSKEIISNNLYLIEDRLKKKVYKLKETGINYVDEIFNLSNLSLNLSDENNKKLNFNGIFNTYIGIVNYRTGALRSGEDNEFPPYIVYGILLDNIYDLLKNERVIKEKIIEKSKAIGDKTRFNILESLKERPYYLKELADKFNTSSASISHHMTILMDNELVTSYYDDRKAYYILNKKEFKTLGEFFINLSEE